VTPEKLAEMFQRHFEGINLAPVSRDTLVTITAGRVLEVANAYAALATEILETLKGTK
jgi:hypothetical protein